MAKNKIVIKVEQISFFGFYKILKTKSVFKFQCCGESE